MGYLNEGLHLTLETFLAQRDKYTHARTQTHTLKEVISLGQPGIIYLNFA